MTAARSRAKWVRFDLPPGKTAREIAEAINKLKKQHRRKNKGAKK